MIEEQGESDVEMEEMDDDGDRPLRQMSKRSMVMKDCAMSIDLEASVYTLEQQIVGCAAIFTGYTVSRILTIAIHLLGAIVWFPVCCRKWVRIACFVEIIIDGVYTCTWCHFADAGVRRSRCQ